MKQVYFKLFISIFSLFLVTTYINAEEAASGPIKIMPLGDSITYDNREADLDDPRPISRRTGYRSHLWYMLRDVNMSVDFVGSRIAGQAIVPSFDPDNEGHPGWHSLDIAEKTYTYMLNSDPDIVLLHIGTNDHGTFAGGVNDILNEIDFYEQASGHQIRVFVALIIDRREPDKAIRLFNENIKKIVDSRSLNGDKLTLVDMYKGAGMRSSDYADNTHPNDRGYLKMATVWFNAIMAPYTPELYTFPASVVSPEFIESSNVNEATSSVTFVTEIPDTGITF